MSDGKVASAPDGGQTTEAPDSDTNTASTSAFDFHQVQSLFCGSLDPLGIWKADPPPPGGFLKDDGILRNGALMDEEELLQYTTAGEAVTTLFQAFQYGVKRRPEAPCMGKRKSADSPYEWATYASVQADAAKIGCFLQALGVTRGQRVGLSGKNAPEYLTAVQGCFWAGATAVRSFFHLCTHLLFLFGNALGLRLPRWTDPGHLCRYPFMIRLAKTNASILSNRLKFK